jgi:hypothetical protein
MTTEPNNIGRLFKDFSGEAQEQFKPERIFSYVRV